MFAIYPHSTGFSFVRMESPDTLLDHGITRVRPLSNQKILERIDKLLDYLEPDIIICRRNENKSYLKSKRIVDLNQKSEKLAEKKNLIVYKYSREQIKDTFQNFGITTKYALAKELVSRFPELSHKMPKLNKIWESEHRNFSLFDALALIATHQYLN